MAPSATAARAWRASCRRSRASTRPQRYELRAGEAFTVIGTRSGYIHPIIADAGGNCVEEPNANPFQVGRIPLEPAGV